MTETQEEPRDAQHQVLAPDPTTDEARLARRTLLGRCRSALKPIPSEELFEVPGRYAESDLYPILLLETHLYRKRLRFCLLNVPTKQAQRRVCGSGLFQA